MVDLELYKERQETSQSSGFLGKLHKAVETVYLRRLNRITDKLRDGDIEKDDLSAQVGINMSGMHVIVDERGSKIRTVTAITVAWNGLYDSSRPPSNVKAKKDEYWQDDGVLRSAGQVPFRTSYYPESQRESAVAMTLGDINATLHRVESAQRSS